MPPLCSCARHRVRHRGTHPASSMWGPSGEWYEATCTSSSNRQSMTHREISSRLYVYKYVWWITSMPGLPLAWPPDVLCVYGVCLCLCCQSYIFNVAYGVGKAGVDRLSRDMAIELRPHNVAAFSLWPGTDTHHTMRLRIRKQASIYPTRPVSFQGLRV